MDQVIRLEVIQNVIVYQALFYRRETPPDAPGMKIISIHHEIRTNTIKTQN